jgi:hypothetical protein
MFSSRGTVRYEERGQGYHNVEKVGKHCLRMKYNTLSHSVPVTTRLIPLQHVLKKSQPQSESANCKIICYINNPLSDQNKVF